jgi:hypothetical protein
VTDHSSLNSGSTLGILQDRRPVAEIVQDYDDQRRARYHLNKVIADMMTDDPIGERMLLCGRRPIPRKKALVVYDQATDRLYRKNLMSCNLVWSCPVCSARITGKRRAELSEVIGNWQGSVIMGAFTVGHHAGDPLDETKKIIDGACRSLFSGRAGQAVKRETGIVGTIQANEVTWSPENGWHPHRHVLFVADRVLTADELARFTDHVTQRFRGLVEKHHGYTGDKAVHVTVGKDCNELLDYFFKWGVADELLAFQVKGSRDEKHLTPFELADRFGALGNQRDRLLFREYITVFRGSRCASYSRGLKALLGIAEKNDQALLEETETVQVLPVDVLPDGASEVLVVADFTTRAVKDISVADQWDDVMGVFRRAIHHELTAMQVGIVFGLWGLRVMLYKNGAMGVYSMGEDPPRPSPETVARIERVNVFWG